MAEALLRRTLVLCGISNVAVNVGGDNHTPTREFVNSSGLTIIDYLVDLSQKELTTMMEKHNKEWPNNARQMSVKPMEIKKLHQISFRIKELNLAGLAFDPDDINDDTWLGKAFGLECPSMEQIRRRNMVNALQSLTMRPDILTGQIISLLSEVMLLC